MGRPERRNSVYPSIQAGVINASESAAMAFRLDTLFLKVIHQAVKVNSNSQGALVLLQRPTRRDPFRAQPFAEPSLWAIEEEGVPPKPPPQEKPLRPYFARLFN